MQTYLAHSYLSVSVVQVVQSLLINPKINTVKLYKMYRNFEADDPSQKINQQDMLN